ncbi:MAG TPA: class I SAM-dependent methyltransferase [Rhizomicrobium sp.]|jgi:predicted O-methyltransferase YrrM|nr:class I SAM-dependent methyltransferase [Rhizomicrobium sp.]
MNTLSTPAFAHFLDRLFADSDASRAVLEARVAALPQARRDAFFTDMADYKTFYSGARDIHLAVSRETARLLYMLARARNARNVVEFGTSFGLSTLHLAAAVRDNGGGGKVITTEFEPSKVQQAGRNFAQAGLAGLIELRAGDALETLACDLPDSIDLLLLDGAKNLYSRILALLEPRLRDGAVIVADNADWSPDYLARVREPENGYLSMPFTEDVELSVRISPG